MASADQSAAGHPAPKTEQEDRIKHLPVEARAAFQRFRSTRDLNELDPILFAILADFIPKPPAVAFSELAGSTQLVEDLGFDSLAITELVFFTEDLFGISISNQEIAQVRSLDDLRGFIRGKVGVGPGA